MRLSRRSLLLGSACAALFPARAFAAPSGFTIDWQGGEQTPEIARSLALQIAIVRSLAIDPAIAAFFAEQTITVDRGANTETRGGVRGVFFARRPLPPDNPVLLHELLHRYHVLRLPGGGTNPDVRRFYRRAKASGQYPANAYMLSNVIEFFAMTVSCVLYGHLARSPFARSHVKAKSPELHDWIVREFGLRL